METKSKMRDDGIMNKRVLTGMRTTGKLHLGHYVGALKRWLAIQNSGEYECFFLLADVQALTTHADRPEILRESIRDVVLDWLAIGLDPSRRNVHFVLQSQIPERAELSIALSMIAGYNEVMRNPTLKSELKDLGHNATMGFIAYPVDQVADIFMVSQVPPKPGDEILVPVGEDQVPHIEYARELTRRFNKKYGEVFVPCNAMVGDIGRLVGTDGKMKMSKSKDNFINLSDDSETVRQQVRKMFTDPKHIRADMPGDTINNPVFVYLRAFDPDQTEVADLEKRYSTGHLGDVEAKEHLISVLNNFLDPIRERRAHFEHKDLREIVMSGTKTARNACIKVTEAIREKMHMVYPQ